MTETLTVQPMQDTIEFALVAEETVVNKTVKLTATIAATIADVTEATLTSNIRDMMKKLIDTTWHFSGTTRRKNASGMEEISLTATTRVDEKENYALDERAEAVSVKGLKIAAIQVDLNPPTAMIEETQSKLRVALLTKATTELNVINTALTAQYRLGEVVFGDPNMAYSNTSNARGVTAMSAMNMNIAQHYSGSGGGSPDTLGNAVKLSMNANIILRHRR